MLLRIKNTQHLLIILKNCFSSSSTDDKVSKNTPIIESEGLDSKKTIKKKTIKGKKAASTKVIKKIPKNKASKKSLTSSVLVDVPPSEADSAFTSETASFKKNSSYDRKRPFIWTFPEEPLTETELPYSLFSLEKFYLRRVKALQEYLQDEVDLLKESPVKNNELLQWCESNLLKINKILDGVQGEFFISLTHVFHSNKYEQVKPHIPLGRLFSKKGFSYSYLSPEIVEFLIHDEYRFFDIVNAHPVFLYEFACDFLEGNRFPYLRGYVLDRDNILLDKARADRTTVAEAKIAIFKTLNTTETHVSNLGYYCKDLYNEVREIRKTLVILVKREYYDYFKDDPEFLSKSLEKQEISMQSLYLQAKEAHYLVYLVRYLYWIIKSDILKVSSKKSFELNSVLDRRVLLPDWVYYFTYIPFSDGVLLGSESADILEQMPDYISQLNKHFFHNSKRVSFREKPLERHSSFLNSEKLNNYLKISTFLDSINMRDFNDINALLLTEPLIFTTTDSDIMGFEFRRFRRDFYQKLILESKACNASFDRTLIAALKQKYPDRLASRSKNTQLSSDASQSSSFDDATQSLSLDNNTFTTFDEDDDDSDI
jgi:hypothetical protein